MASLSMYPRGSCSDPYCLCQGGYGHSDYATGTSNSSWGYVDRNSTAQKKCTNCGRKQGEIKESKIKETEVPFYQSLIDFYRQLKPEVVKECESDSCGEVGCLLERVKSRLSIKKKEGLVGIEPVKEKGMRLKFGDIVTIRPRNGKGARQAKIIHRTYHDKNHAGKDRCPPFKVQYIEDGSTECLWAEGFFESYNKIFTDIYDYKI